MGCSFANTEWQSRCIYDLQQSSYKECTYIYIYIYTYILTQSFWTGNKVIRRKHIVQPTGFGSCSYYLLQSKFAMTNMSFYARTSYKHNRQYLVHDKYSIIGQPSTCYIGCIHLYFVPILSIDGVYIIYIKRETTLFEIVWFHVLHFFWCLWPGLVWDRSCPHVPSHRVPSSCSSFVNILD